MSLMLNTGVMKYREDSSSSWQPLVLAANVDLVSLADRFSTSSTYEVGEYVLYDGAMYRCITAVTTAGAWDSAKWIEVNIGDELYNLNATLNNAILEGAEQTITASTQNVTSDWISLPGLTENHKVANWGMRTSTDPIAENTPPCDIEIEKDTDRWRYTLGANSTAFYLKPTFILKQN